MNIRDLRYVVAVADHCHFGQAAEACHVGQPTLSSQIRKLEEQLGATLFERTKRSVRVTPLGEEIVAKARALIALADEIEETAAARRNPLSGPLRLGMIPTLGPYLTPILLPSIRHGLPEVQLDLAESVTEQLEARLLTGELDAAILATAPGDRRLDEIALFEEPFWVALPRGHPLQDREEVALADLESDELLLLEDGHCLSDQVLSFCGRAFSGAGVGVTLVPALSLAGSWVTDSGVLLRKEKSRAASRAVRLVFRASFPRRQLIDKLADILCAMVPDTVAPARR
jgi:LysR family hydrogen peroxide-inducible transcriptional activator